MPLSTVLLIMGAAGLIAVLAGVVVLHAIGARPSLARRLAGPPERKVGRVLDRSAHEGGLVRVAGRIRCRDPLEAGGGERLVAFHRDVEVRIGRRWKSIERLRETRSFELWDHEGSAEIDPAGAAEPLITIPKVWRGSVTELGEPHASVVARLRERHGTVEEARATTRTINVTDRLLVLARPTTGTDGRINLAPPEGGYLLTNLALEDAMRLLGGRHRRLAASAVIAQGLGVALAVIGVLGGVAARALGV